MALQSSAPSANLMPGAAGFDLAALRRTRAYDLAMRLPLLLYSLFLAVFSALGLFYYLHNPGAGLSAAGFAVGVAMRVSTVAYFVVLAASVIIRDQAKGQAEGVEPRISALIGTFAICAVTLFPRHELSLAGQTAATVLLVVGNALSIFVLVQLGRSFSIMAEARELVTSGIYRWVRHPLYLAEELAVLGLLLQFLSWGAVLLLALQIGFQLRRMRNEERVLALIFPEYATYKEMTGMLVPRFGRVVLPVIARRD